VLYGFKLALTLAFAVWLWQYLRTQNLALAWRQLHPGWLAVAIALIPINIGLQFLKWHALLRLAQPQCPAQVSLYSLFAGFPLGLLTPGRWGELGRAMYVPQLPREEVFFLSAMDKIHALLVNAWVGGLALVYLIYKNLLPGKWSWFAWFAAIIFLFLSIALLLPSLLCRWRNVLRRPSLKEDRPGTEEWQVAVPRLIAIYLYSLLFVVIYCAQMAILVRGIFAVDFTPALAGAAAIFFLKNALPLTIGELGVREGLAVYFFTALHVPAAAALQASLMLFLFNLVLPALAGLLWIWKRKSEDQRCC
jgi:uncharacterized membrane protein YbhN (UPF0104 family)